MKESSWKFFVGVGILLIIAGAYVYPLDDIIGLIGMLLGGYNIYKGIRLGRGKQPYLIRKQRETVEKHDQELQEQLNQNNKENKK